jgi:hypothetical protein
MKNSVMEGTDDGTFQQLGVMSRAAETKKQLKQQQAETFRKSNSELFARLKALDRLAKRNRIASASGKQIRT